jgi:hypothetical protein
MLKKCSEWLVSNTLSNKDKLKVGQHLICDQPREGEKWIGRLITLQSHTILMTVGEVGHTVIFNANRFIGYTDTHVKWLNPKKKSFFGQKKNWSQI